MGSGDAEAPYGAASARARRRHPESAPTPRRLVDTPLFFERFLYGLALVDPGGEVLYLNRKARQLLMSADHAATADAWTCCELICNRLGPIVGGGCLTEMVGRAGGQIPEVRMDIEQERLRSAAWVTASPFEADGPQVLFHLRPGQTGDRRRRASSEWSGEGGDRRRPDLQITTLGSFRVEGSAGPLNGEWLEQRPGQLLKYLVCERRRTMASDRIGEALWPEAGVDEGRNRLRYYVHALRDRLEPNRAHRSPTSFVVAHRGGYVFDTTGVWIDTDEFEREANAGLATFEQGLQESAAAHLAAALGFYRGSFLSEDPYAEWALEERERLHELAGRALRAQIQIEIGRGQLQGAAEDARRLSEMEPFDSDVQKLFIEICLRRGRRSEAVRRYAFFRKRMADSFGQQPDFDLLEMERRFGSTNVQTSPAP